MKIKELYEKGKSLLESAGISDAQFDALCLFEEFTGFCKNDLIIFPEKEVDEYSEKRFISAVSKRASKIPLQHILGVWQFLSLELFVGEGVLIPRPETELVCTVAAGLCKENAKILDLCAGSGAIGLGICSLRKDVSALCVEYCDKALEYLEKNILKYLNLPVSFCKYDALSLPKSLFGKYDMIVSNPPYIRSEEIPFLQSEVLFDPLFALDGGKDGLKFYRFIIENWRSAINKGGFIVFEIGEDQGNDITSLLKENGFTDVYITKDFSGNDRIAVGTLK